MILNVLRQIGMALGAMLTVTAFAVNIGALIRGRRIFRNKRSCPVNYM